MRSLIIIVVKRILDIEKLIEAFPKNFSIVDLDSNEGKIKSIHLSFLRDELRFLNNFLDNLIEYNHE